MKTKLIKFVLAFVLALTATNAVSARPGSSAVSNTVPVIVDNFIRAETDTVCVGLVAQGGFGKMPVSFQFGRCYYSDKPSGGPDWGLRFTLTFVFPK